MTTYNLYCDESCHLENDGHLAMVFGALVVPYGRHKALSNELKELKKKHDIFHNTEAKWGKISPAKVDFYIELIDWFFSEPELKFRALVVPDKNILNHDGFNQTHDDFYYKCWYQTIITLLSRENSFNIYLDKKDTRSQAKAVKLEEVLNNKLLDFDKSIIKRIQHAHSHEVPLFQLTDVLLGAISYVNRGLSTSEAKVSVLQRIREKSKLGLNRTTLLREEKLNILVWQPGGNL
ncbi:DUF3800 domain-containing protein [Comamonas sp. MYb21]|uniref:DUF3800 domain-containing protein n=1 Tax=Comamonas sp. MYb21 TaxID=1848648 RepID=UPI0030A83DAB